MAADPGALPSGVRVLIDSAEEIFVLSPTRPSRVDWITSDTDRARVSADHRLRAVLGQLEELGVDARGAVASDDRSRRCYCADGRSAGGDGGSSPPAAAVTGIRQDEQQE